MLRKKIFFHLLKALARLPANLFDKFLHALRPRWAGQHGVHRDAAASPWAIACPIPAVDPVTIAVLPSSLMIILYSLSTTRGCPARE